MYDKICPGQLFTNMFPSNENLFRKYFHKGCGSGSKIYEQMHLKRNAIYNNVLDNLWTVQAQANWNEQTTQTTILKVSFKHWTSNSNKNEN